jgi:hypothetical protein
VAKLSTDARCKETALDHTHRRPLEDDPELRLKRPVISGSARFQSRDGSFMQISDQDFCHHHSLRRPCIDNDRTIAPLSL